MKTQDELVGEQIAVQIIARIDAATARPACTNPAAMTERLIDAVIYAETASGPYVRAARKEVNDARAAIEEALTAAEARIKMLSEALAEAQAAEAYQRGKVVAEARIIERFRNEREPTHGASDEG